MSSADLLALLPLLVVTGTSVAVLLLIAFHRCHSATFALTLAGLAAAFAALCLAPAESVQVTPLLVMDSFARFFMGLIFAASAVVALFARDYLVRDKVGQASRLFPEPSAVTKTETGQARSLSPSLRCANACGKQAGRLSYFGTERPEEFYLLLLTATLGAAVLTASNHYASFFLGLEILSVSLYALIAYVRENRNGTEAALKYLILAGVSSAFLLFGMALVFAETGSLEFGRAVTFAVGRTFEMARPTDGLVGGMTQPIVQAAVALMLVGIGFKLAVVPFHLWTPDVYQGAPAPVTAYVATVSKGAMFALLLRLFGHANLANSPEILLVFTLIAIASMLVGNLLALLQDNVKRILAYSSIAHLGYLLVAFLASGEQRIQAVAFYLVAYFITTLGTFGIVGALSGPDRDADDIEDYRGLFWRRPWLAAVFTAMLLSLAGIPLTAGFIGKFYLVLAGVGSALWTLVVVLAVSSAIGLFYYLRIVVALYAQPEETERNSAPATPDLAHSPGSAPSRRLRWASCTALTVLVVLLLGLGVYPSPLFALIQTVFASWR